MTFVIDDNLDMVWARLVTSQPSFAALVLQCPVPLKMHYGDPNYTLRCSATDIRVGYEWLLEHEPDVQVAGVLHELVHWMFAHVPWYRQAKAAGTINGLPFIDQYAQYALDYLVNDTLANMGVSIPRDWLRDQTIGMWTESEETIYERVFKWDPQGLAKARARADAAADGGEDRASAGAGVGREPTPQGPRPGQGEPSGDIDPEPQPGEGEGAEVPTADTGRMQRLARQVLEDCPKLQGAGAGDLQRVLQRVCPTHINWRDVIRPKVKHILGKDNASWAVPNRRAMSIKAVLPGRIGTQAGFVCIVVDTSGSIYDHELAKFAAGIEEIMNGCHPKKLLLLETDWIVQKASYLKSPKEVRSAGKFAGGGGTRMPAAFDWLSEHNLRPDLVIVLTDMETGFPASMTPAKDVVWVSTRPHAPAPVAAGRTVYMPQR